MAIELSHITYNRLDMLRDEIRMLLIDQKVEKETVPFESETTEKFLCRFPDAPRSKRQGTQLTAELLEMSAEDARHVKALGMAVVPFLFRITSNCDMTLVVSPVIMAERSICFNRNIIA